MKLLKEKIDKNKIPRHVAIIMDGNGRWAAMHGSERTFGHEHGVDAVRSTVEGASEIGIEFLTLYAFSTENWERPKEEVDALMGLLVQAIENETEELRKNNVRLDAIGDLDKLPEDVHQKLRECIQSLSSNTGLNLVLVLSYSSRWEIADAARKIARDAKAGKLNPEDMDNTTFEKYLAT